MLPRRHQMSESRLARAQLLVWRDDAQPGHEWSVSWTNRSQSMQNTQLHCWHRYPCNDNNNVDPCSRLSTARGPCRCNISWILPNWFKQHHAYKKTCVTLTLIFDMPLDAENDTVVASVGSSKSITHAHLRRSKSSPKNVKNETDWKKVEEKRNVFTCCIKMRPSLKVFNLIHQLNPAFHDTVFAYLSNFCQHTHTSKQI